MMIQDQRGRGAQESAVQHLMQSAAQSPDVAGLFSLFSTHTPRVYAGIDRVQSEILGVPTSRVFETLEIYLGSSFINEFNLLGRTFRVTAQADGQFRLDLHAIANLKTRNDAGEMVPIGAVAAFQDRTGAYRVPCYNLWRSFSGRCRPLTRLYAPSI
jgi:HAE1 family hydrophobic/amphiphilic exporter-1